MAIGRRNTLRGNTYSMPRLFGFALDRMITLTSKLLHCGLYVASFTLLVVTAYGVCVLVTQAQELLPVNGWTSTILLILVEQSFTTRRARQAELDFPS